MRDIRTAGGRPRAMTMTWVAVTILSLVLTACSGGGPGGSDRDTGTSVPVGASAVQWQEALADMKPIALKIQVSQPSADSAGAKPTVELGEWLDEMSGGKVTLDIAYANSIVPDFTETDDALVDGRLDLGNLFPAIEPSEYPLNAALVEASALRPEGVVDSDITSIGALNEAFWEFDGLVEELRDKGIEPVIAMSGLNAPVLFCKAPIVGLKDFAGRQVRVNAAAESAFLKSLGAVPVSLPNPEVFEGLQRGVIDCASGGLRSGVAYGYLDVAANVYYSPAAHFPNTPAVRGWGSRVSDLPLPARQLVWDAMIHAQTRAIHYEYGGEYMAALKTLQEKGISVTDLDAETSAVLSKAIDERVDSWAELKGIDGKAFGARVRELMAQWDVDVAKSVYEDGGSMAEFLDWFGTDEVDLNAFEEMLHRGWANDQRPGA